MRRARLESRVLWVTYDRSTVSSEIAAPWQTATRPQLALHIISPFWSNTATCRHPLTLSRAWLVLHHKSLENAERARSHILHAASTHAFTGLAGWALLWRFGVFYQLVTALCGLGSRSLLHGEPQDIPKISKPKPERPASDHDTYSKRHVRPDHNK